MHPLGDALGTNQSEFYVPIGTIFCLNLNINKHWSESGKETHNHMQNWLDWYSHLYVTLKWEPTNYKQWIHKWNFHTTLMNCCYCWVKWLNFVNIWLTEKCLKCLDVFALRTWRAFMCEHYPPPHLFIYLSAHWVVRPAGSKSFKLKLTPMFHVYVHIELNF